MGQEDDDESWKLGARAYTAWMERWRVEKLRNLVLCRSYSYLLWFNPAAGNWELDTCSLSPPLPPQKDGEENWWKGKTLGLRWRQFNKRTKEILLLVIIMHMQNKQYTIQFFLTVQWLILSQSPSSGCGFHGTPSWKSSNSWKSLNLRAKEGSCPRANPHS